MLYLTSTSDKLRLTTSAATTVHVHATWADAPSSITSSATFVPGRLNTPITTATTTDIVASPAASTTRTVKTLAIRNTHATTANDVTVILTDGTNAMELCKVTLYAGYTLWYIEGAGFWMTDTRGANVFNEQTGGVQAAVNALNLVVLSGDVTNNNAVANTIADVTGLSFAVTANETYKFKFTIPYTAAATTTGSRWAINGPGSPTLLNYTSHYALTATSETVNYATAYDIPAASNATSLTAGNIAIIEGIIKPSANGTVIARFASEVASSAIVAKAGALLEWYRTL